MSYCFGYGINIINEDTGENIHFQIEEWYSNDKEYFDEYREEIVKLDKDHFAQEVVYNKAMQRRVKIKDVKIDYDDTSIIASYRTDDPISINGKHSTHSFIIEEHYYVKD